MSVLILNCERDEVGGQYLVASIHGVEHCVSLDDDYPEQIRLFAFKGVADF